ncbi:MAG: hypothetical protein IJO26_03450 [Clostridium sp.]|nr:hypothetical protein [Clostridium sp.]
MYELVKNIGLGLFVNGTFAILNGDINIKTVSITIASVFIMYSAITIPKRKKRWTDKH